jgi:hypothetical protein
MSVSRILDLIAPLDSDGRPNGNIGMIARLIADRRFREAEYTHVEDEAE